ncbi:MAG TPA: VOC family protein [Gaiellaceae bacterium]
MIGRLEIVMVVVSDMERSVAFYRDTLGLQVVEQSPYWSELDAGTIHVGLHPSEGGEVPHGEGVTLLFYVDDAEQTVGQLRERGAEIAMEPKRQEWQGVLAAVKDPDGHLIQLLQNA